MVRAVPGRERGEETPPGCRPGLIRLPGSSRAARRRCGRRWRWCRSSVAIRAVVRVRVFISCSFRCVQCVSCVGKGSAFHDIQSRQSITVFHPTRPRQRREMGASAHNDICGNGRWVTGAYGAVIRARLRDEKTPRPDGWGVSQDRVATGRERQPGLTGSSA